MSEGKFTGAIGAIIENTVSGNILLLRRAPTKDFIPNTWEEVTGRMKQFESPEETVHREVLEETGISEIEIVKPIAVRHYFRGSQETAENEVLLIVYWCRTSVDAVTISVEHSEYRWLSPEEAIQLADYPAVRGELEIYLKERQSNSK